MPIVSAPTWKTWKRGLAPVESPIRSSQPPVPSVCPVCRSKKVRYFQRVDDHLYWRCQLCQATFLDPAQRLDEQAEKAHYDHHQNEISDPGYRRFLSRLADPLMQRLAGRQGPQQGLDYGCGPGPALAAMLQAAGHSMSVWDPIYAPDRHALQARYDFITCTEVLEHCYEPAQVFAQMIGLLKPDGWLGVMTTFQTDDDRFVGWHYRRDPTHVVFYRPFTLTYLAEVHDCSIEFPTANVALLQRRPATLSQQQR